jgi:Na+/H+ antiporter NhaC
MGYIFIFSAVFTYVMRLIGGVDVAAALGLYFIPKSLILPGLFTVVSIFAVAIGSSMGTIAAFLPIGIGIASKLGINPSLMAGVIVGGSMLGDNLSLISDTTIAATQTTGCRMSDKFKMNFWLVLPAFFLTFAVLAWLNYGITSESTHELLLSHVGRYDALKILPYGLILGLALLGLDVIAVLLVGIVSALGIGVWYGYFSFTESTSMIVDGFSQSRDIQQVLLLSFFVAGLSKIVEHNGGLRFLLDRLSRRVKSKAGAEVVVAVLIFVVNAAVAINTVAILITGPVAKRIGTRFDIPGKRLACILDIFSCICQGVIPYAPQLLLAGSIAGVSSVSIIPYLHYQGFIFLVASVSIIRTFLR